MLIDIHSHAYRVKMPFVTPFCTLPELLKEQERLGIDMSVVMPIVSPEIYIPQNTEDIIDMAREYPDRIIPFCNIDPRSLTNSPHAKFEDLMEFYKEKGCKGIGEVMPNMRMDDPRVQNLFRAAVRMAATAASSVPRHWTAALAAAPAARPALPVPSPRTTRPSTMTSASPVSAAFRSAP